MDRTISYAETVRGSGVEREHSRDLVWARDWPEVREGTSAGVCEAAEESEGGMVPEIDGREILHEEGGRRLGVECEIHEQGRKRRGVQGTAGEASRGANGSHRVERDIEAEARDRDRRASGAASESAGEISETRQSIEDGIFEEADAAIQTRRSDSSLGRNRYVQDERALRRRSIRFFGLRRQMVGWIRRGICSLIGRILRWNQMEFISDLVRWLSAALEG